MSGYHVWSCACWLSGFGDPYLQARSLAESVVLTALRRVAAVTHTGSRSRKNRGGFALAALAVTRRVPSVVRYFVGPAPQIYLQSSGNLVSSIGMFHTPAVS